MCVLYCCLCCEIVNDVNWGLLLEDLIISLFVSNLWCQCPNVMLTHVRKSCLSILKCLFNILCHLHDPGTSLDISPIIAAINSKCSPLLDLFLYHFTKRSLQVPLDITTRILPDASTRCFHVKQLLLSEGC